MIKLKQKCYVCKYEALWTIEKPEDESIIRASCLPCGHQGMFSLEKVNE